MVILELLRDQLVSRELDEHGQRIQEYDVWFEGSYLGTIEKKHEQYFNTLNNTVRYSLTGALLEFSDVAIESNDDVALIVAQEAPETTIFKYFRNLFK